MNKLQSTSITWFYLKQYLQPGWLLAYFLVCVTLGQVAYSFMNKEIKVICNHSPLRRCPLYKDKSK